MANSSITLYRGCKALKDKNFIIEDIEDYLSTLAAYNIGDFQYLKNGLKLSIKVDISQNELDAGKLFDESYNYIKVVANNEDMIYYYFIDNRVWTSKNTITFELTQDTLNTYHAGRDYELSEYTKIQRQHKDRLIKRHDVVQEGTAGTSVTAYDWQTVYDYSFAQMSMILEDAPANTDLEIDIRFIDRQPASFTYAYNKVNRTLTIYLTSTTGPMMITSEVTWRYTTDSYVRKIDLLSEGIQAPKYHNELEDVEIHDNYDEDWYLVYKNKNDIDPDNPEKPNPVECFLVPGNPLKINIYDKSGDYLTVGDLEAGKYYYCCDYANPADLTDENGSVVAQVFEYIKSSPAQGNIPSVNIHNRWGALIYLENGKITVSQLSWMINGRYVTKTVESTRKGLTEVHFGIPSCVYHRSTTKTKDLEVAAGYDSLTWTFGGAITTDIYDINDSAWDRTDPKLIKIIKLPYIPTEISVEDSDEGKFVRINSLDWEFNNDTHALKLYTRTQKLEKEFNIKEQYNPFEALNKLNINLSTNALRDDNNESKLYHSDFYQPKFVYDSFGLSFNLEAVNSSKYLLDNAFNLKYNVTTTMNSRFLFSFPQYVSSLASQDYNNIVCVARNNEIPLYTSAYLNYVRTGYNYDVKNKQNALAKGVATTVVSAAGGAILGAVKGSGGGPVGIAVGAAIGLATGIISTAASQAQAENNINQKLEEAQNQAVSVAGSDDIDILTAYSNNRAKMVTYKCSDTMKSLLSDLFYYCGYIENIMSKPNMNSRYWFNYIQCEADIEMPGNFNRDVLDNIKQKYLEGVTVMHVHRDLAGQNPQWDLDQEKENWEVSIL